MRLGLQLGALVGAALAVGCLEDLPPAEQCPAPAAVEGVVTDCTTALSNAVMAGYMIDYTDACLLEDPSFTACYRGPGGCACRPGECTAPEDRQACFPRDDCPPLVRLHHPGARCITLGRDDIGRGVSEEEQCLCGCEECMSVCDGRGPVWGQVEVVQIEDNMPPIYFDPEGMLYFDVQRYMPAAGKMGVYVRARGFSSGLMSMWESGPVYAALGTAEGWDGMIPWAVPLPFVLGDGFEEVVLTTLPEGLHSWQMEDEKPAIVGLFPGVNTVTLMEIDCVIPFVIE